MIETPGRRVADNTPNRRLQPGDYSRHPIDAMPASTPWWGLCTPTGAIVWARHGSTHAVIEHPDGTVTISPMLLATDGWHGRLESGVWREMPSEPDDAA